jgi:hypothetical protein
MNEITELLKVWVGHVKRAQREQRILLRAMAWGGFYDWPSGARSRAEGDSRSDAPTAEGGVSVRRKLRTARWLLQSIRLTRADKPSSNPLTIGGY